MNNFTRRVKKIHTIGTCLYEIMVVILTLCATTCLYSDELQDDIQYFKDLKNNLSKNTTDENCNKWINGIEEKYLKHKDHPIYAAYYAYPSYVKTNDVNKALLMLVPFMQENVTYPRISLAFWELFYCGLRNTEYGHMNGWEKVLNGIDKKEQPEALKKLTAYWASLVPGSFITPTSNVWEAKKLKVDMAECRAVWKIVFRNLMKMELAEEYE
ncbi:MAG: hypothetical protein IJT83_00320 [Victivallales bacterium]|nr:hypothetical protein [Victivallales bacterium]